MKYFRIETDDDSLAAIHTLEHDHLGSEELLIFDYAATLEFLPQFFYRLNPYLKKTSHAAMIIRESEAPPDDLARYWVTDAIHQLIVRLKPIAGTQEVSWLSDHMPHPVAEDFASRFKKYIWFGKERNIEVVPELQLVGLLPHLGSVLVKLRESEAPYIALYGNTRPTVTDIRSVKKALELYQMVAGEKKPIYFLPDQSSAPVWQAASLNHFQGPTEVHIDTANTCTHSCRFCGLYSPEVIDSQRKDGRLPAELTQMMKAQLAPDAFRSLIKALPFNTEMIQLGGKGDPLTHPQHMEFIRAIRNRGFNIELLSNMEYLDEESCLELHSLGSRLFHGMHIIANVSAATAEVYTKTRPRQTEQTFEKVTRNIKQLGDLRRKDRGLGVHITLMCVTYEDNFHQAADYVQLAYDLNCERVWFKPIEVHDPLHEKLIPKQQQKEFYIQCLRDALKKADDLGVEVFERHVIESLTAQTTAPSQSTTTPGQHSAQQMPVLNADTPRNLYNQIPCRIGYTYTRLEVEGLVRPCCISRHPVGQLKSDSFNKVWSSGEYLAFRQKTGRIRQEKFHITDPEWTFCQQCSHTQTNKRHFALESQVEGES